MRLYITVAVLTFVGCLAAYSGTNMFSAANAIGGSQTGSSSFLTHFNPFFLLQGDRLRAMLSSNSSLPRMEPFRSNFNSSDMWRSVQSSRIDPGFGRNVYVAPPRPVTVPHVYVPPVRFGR